MNVYRIVKNFKTQEECLSYLETVRWKGKPQCSYCKSEKSSKYVGTRYYVCMECKNSYSVTVGTLFHDSKIELVKWFMAISLILNAKKGISACQLKRDLEIGSYKTAWRMLRLIRIAMVDENMKKYFQDIVEMDETYVGGKPGKFEKSKRGRGTKKVPVIGVMDRLEKKVFCKVAKKNEIGQQLSGKQLIDVLEQVCIKRKSLWVMTDEFRSYKPLKTNGWNHAVIDHSKEFVSGDVHTNTIESFWAILKRGIYGIYHNISAKYMQQYINEFCFRYNNRNENDAFDFVLNKAMKIKSV